MFLGVHLAVGEEDTQMVGKLPWDDKKGRKLTSSEPAVVGGVLLSGGQIGIRNISHLVFPIFSVGVEKKKENIWVFKNTEVF